MNRLTTSIAALTIATAVFAGCGGENASPDSLPALSVEDWTTLPQGEKFNSETLVRLRASVPEFEDQEKWQQFLINEAMPQKK